MIRYLSLITCVLVCLTGCSFTPKYTQPEAPVPAQWPTGEAYKALKTADIPTPQLRWQEFFTDARMQQLIETALNNNRDLRLAALSVERTRALYGIERAGLLPTASATVSDSNKRSSYDSVRVEEPRTTQQYSVNLGIASWEIDFFGRISSLKDAALQQYLSTQQARRSAQLSLISAVADTYLSLAANLEILALAKSTLDVQQATYELIKRRYDVGLASELDLRRVQTQVATASGDVARYTQLAAQGENALNLLVGSPIPQELLPVDLSSVSPLDDIFPDLSSEVLLSRPDVIEAEAILKAASANIGAARAAFFPRISLTAAIGTTSDELSGLFKSASGTWSFAPQITMPIFDARTRPALRVSKADMDVALTQYEKAVQTAFREVADALATYGTIDRQVLAQESTLSAVSETNRLAFARYTKGIDSYLSVLDSQRSLYSAQQGLVNVRLSKLTNLVTLYKVLGGGTKAYTEPY